MVKQISDMHPSADQNPLSGLFVARSFRYQ